MVEEATIYINNLYAQVILCSKKKTQKFIFQNSKVMYKINTSLVTFEHVDTKSINFAIVNIQGAQI